MTAVLADWQSLADFTREVAHRRQVGTPDIWRQDHRKTLEAILAVEFCRERRVKLVRMVEDDADFEVRTRDGRILRVQTTEVLRPERKRTLEYEAWRDSGWAPIESDGLQEDDAPSLVLKWLAKRVQEKADKHYSVRNTLLVYLNAGGFFVNEVEVQRGMVDACRSGRDKFSSIWVLWGGRFYRCWPNPWWDPDADFRPDPEPLTSYVNERRLFWEAFGRE